LKDRENSKHSTGSMGLENQRGPSRRVAALFVAAALAMIALSALLACAGAGFWLFTERRRARRVKR
jgi:hypothetical protein